MKHLHTSLIFAIVSKLIIYSAAAQSNSGIPAGQISGTQYTILSPAKSFIEQPIPSSTINYYRDSLDIDLDGRKDLLITNELTNSRYYHVRTSLSSLNPNTQIAAMFSRLLSYPAGHQIEANVSTNSTIHYNMPGAWMSTADLLNYWSIGGTINTDFTIPSTSYIAIRMLSGNTWRYGWIRIHLIGWRPWHYQIDAHALQVAPLQIQQTDAPAEWQIFPAPVDDVLTIQAPTNLQGSGQLFDNIGRSVIAPFKLMIGQPTSVSLVHLPAGIYLLRVDTESGSFKRRVIKQ